MWCTIYTEGTCSWHSHSPLILCNTSLLIFFQGQYSVIFIRHYALNNSLLNLFIIICRRPMAPKQQRVSLRKHCKSIPVLCLFLKSWQLPWNSPQMTFILLLTFLKIDGESDHYTWNLWLLNGDGLLAENEIVIPHNAPVFPTYETSKKVNGTCRILFLSESRVIGRSNQEKWMLISYRGRTLSCLSHCFCSRSNWEI